MRQALGGESIVLGDLVLLEVLQGIDTERRAATLERWLRSFSIVPLLGDEAAVQAARNDRMLRSRGITVRKTVDLVIGTYCISHGLPLLHDDRDFDAMAAHLPLQVVGHA